MGLSRLACGRSVVRRVLLAHICRVPHWRGALILPVFSACGSWMLGGVPLGASLASFGASLAFASVACIWLFAMHRLSASADGQSAGAAFLPVGVVLSTSLARSFAMSSRRCWYSKSPTWCSLSSKRFGCIRELAWAGQMGLAFRPIAAKKMVGIRQLAGFSIARPPKCGTHAPGSLGITTSLREKRRSFLPWPKDAPLRRSPRRRA